jgi:hypothetical protein
MPRHQDDASFAPCFTTCSQKLFRHNGLNYKQSTIYGRKERKSMSMHRKLPRTLSPLLWVERVPLSALLLLAVKRDNQQLCNGDISKRVGLSIIHLMVSLSSPPVVDHSTGGCFIRSERVSLFGGAIKSFSHGN